jgi:hypothetical protein
MGPMFLEKNANFDAMRITIWMLLHLTTIL